MTYRIRPNMPALGKRGYGKLIPALKSWLENEADGAEIARATTRGERYTVPMIDEPL